MNRYWLLHSGLEAAFATELQRRGYNVTAVGCDAAVDTCDNMFYRRDRPFDVLTHRCNYCAFMLRKLCKRVGVRYVSMREYIKQHAFENGKVKNRNYRDVVAESWVRLLRSVDPKEEGELCLRDMVIESARTVDAFLDDFLERAPVDLVIMVNGKFFAEKLLSEHCRRRSIPFVAYERGAIRETLMFSKNKPAIPADTHQRWLSRKHLPLRAEERERLSDYLNQRKVLGNAELVPFYEGLEENEAALRQTIGIPSGARIVVAFTNSIWDSSVVGEDTIFRDMFDWLKCCVDVCRELENTVLVVRVHPVEVRCSMNQQSRDQAADILFDEFGEMDSLRVVPPESDTSPYTLMEMADLGLVYTSTTGLEMALRGKPVIVTAHTHYSGTEFVYTPQSREEFRELVASGPPPRKDQIGYAERYAFMYYFEHMIPYGDLIQQCGADYRFRRDIREAQILERAGL